MHYVSIGKRMAAKHATRQWMDVPGRGAENRVSERPVHAEAGMSAKGNLFMIRLRILALIPFVILLGCDGFTSRFNRRTRGIIRGATKVEVFRTRDREEWGKPRLEGVQRICGFPVIAQGADQGPPFAARLAEVLLAEQSYTDRYAKCFWPGVAYRVWKDDDYVDVLICFFCHNLYCGPPNDETMANASFLEMPAESKFVRLAKEAFPDDKEIQELKE